MTTGAESPLRPWSRSSIGATVAIIAAVAIALMLDPHARADFAWQASRWPDEPWRLVTCHFVHLGPRHLFANLLALTALAWTASRQAVGASFTAGAVASAAAVSAGIAFGPMALDWYAGLSGVLYGVFARETLRLAENGQPYRGLGFALYCGALLKVVLDLDVANGTIGALGIPLAPPAHFYGYLGGSIAAVAAAVRTRRGRLA